MGMAEVKDLWFFRFRGNTRIDQTFSKVLLAFQHGQACQADSIKTGSLRHFIIDNNAVMLIAGEPDYVHVHKDI